MILGHTEGRPAWSNCDRPQWTNRFPIGRHGVCVRPPVLGDAVVNSEKVQMTEAKTHGYDHGARCNCRATTDHDSLFAAPQRLIILQTAATVPKRNFAVV